MLKIFVVLKLSVFFTLTLPGQGTKIIVDLNQPVECQKGEYKLVFQDDFEGNTLDTTKWYTFYPYGPETRPDSCAFCRTHTSANVYREQNVKVENGFLTLKSARETSNWFGAEYVILPEWSTANRLLRLIPNTRYDANCPRANTNGLLSGFLAGVRNLMFLNLFAGDRVNLNSASTNGGNLNVLIRKKLAGEHPVIQARQGS